MKNINNYYFIIKYVFIFTIDFYIFFLNYIYIDIDNKKIIEIDNEFKENFYQEEIKFDKYQTKLKPIALYYPEFNNISYSKYFNTSFKKDYLDINGIKEVVKAQIKLAKNHQIYGFAIYYNHFNSNYFSKIIADAF